MKPAKKILTLIVLTFFVLNANNTFCQQKSVPKVKTVTVYEEKLDKIIAKKYKESETTYDARGNVLELIEYVDNKVDTHFQYQYDSFDNKIKEIEFDSSGKVKKTSEYKYEKGLRIEKTVFDADGKLKTKKTYIYTMY